MHPTIEKYLDEIDALLFDAVRRAFSIFDQNSADAFIHNFSVNLKAERRTFSSSALSSPEDITRAYKIALDRTINSDVEFAGDFGKTLTKLIYPLIDRLYPLLDRVEDKLSNSLGSRKT